MNVYTVRDKLVGFTGPLAFEDNKVAERWFEAFCKQKKQNEYTEAKYYELYKIGTYDHETAKIEGTYPIELVKEGEQFDE